MANLDTGTAQRERILFRAKNHDADKFFCHDGQYRSAETLEVVNSDMILSDFWNKRQIAQKKYTVHNFEVAETHTYIAGGYRVHNTSTLAFYDPAENGILVNVGHDAQGRVVWDSVTPDGGHWHTVSTTTPGSNTITVTKTYTLGAFNQDGTPVINPQTGEPVSRFYIQTGNDYEIINGVPVLKDVVINENYWLFGDEYGGEIAGIFTPFILQAIGADSVFERLTVGTLTHTLLQNLLEGGFDAIHASLLDMPMNGETFNGMIFGSWDDFGIDLAVNGLDSAVSLMQQVIMGEIYSTFDINSVPEQFMAQLVSEGIENVLAGGIDNFIDNILGPDSALAIGYDPEIMDFSNVQAYTGLLMGVLLDEIIPGPDTPEGSIASSIARLLTKEWTQSLSVASLGFFSALPGMIVAQLIGAVVGAIFDAIFDKDPEAFSNLTFNTTTGRWSITSQTRHDGGSLELASQLGHSLMDKLNEIGELMQSTDLQFGTSQISIGHYEKHLRNGDGVNYGMTDTSVIFAAIVSAITNATASDGDLKVLRALNLPELATELAGKTPTEAFSIIYSQARLAADYQYYLDNAFSINSLMLSAPNSAEARAWALTLLQVRAAGLDAAYSGVGTADDNLFLTADGADTVSGATGNDTIKSYGGDDSISGGDGNDAIHAGNGNDTVLGGAGNDVILGEAGSDSLNGGDDADQLFGGDDGDIVYGDAGNDIISGGLGADTIFGGADTDRLDYTTSALGVAVNLTLGVGTAGDSSGDVISEIENLLGSSHSDTLIGDAISNRIEGSAGNDHIWGMTGNDQLYGGTGDDEIFGDQGQGLILGGNDALYGGDGADTLHGDSGIDTFDGGAGNDVVSFLYARSAAIASLASGVVLIGSTIETMTSIEGLTGSNFGDQLTGDDHANTLQGGYGDDVLDGDAGNDVYIYSYGDGSDVITDWQSTDNIDVLRISGANANDVLFSQDADENLVITFDNRQKILIEHQFLGDHTWNSIEEISFADGTTLDLVDIRNKMVSDMKASGFVIGTDFAETYYHSIGDGSYTISDWDTDGRIDRLILDNATATDFSLSQNADSDLLIQFTNGEVIRVQDQFQAESQWWGIEELVLANGTVMDFAAIRARVVSDMKATGTVIGTKFADAYVHKVGDGSYTIYDNDSALHADSLTFFDLNSTQVSLIQDGNDLRLVTNVGDTITIVQHFTTNNKLESIHFADGVVWSVDDFTAHLTPVGSVSGQIIGTVANDSYSHTGGSGSITITDYNYSHGLDTLQFTDQTASDLTFSRVGNDLVLTRSNGETVTIHRQLDENLSYTVETLLFSDGTSMSEVQMRNRLMSDMKSSGSVVGTANSDTYVHESGDGSYSIADYDYYSSSDSLILSDQNAGDIHLTRSGDSLLVHLAGGDVITLIGQLDSSLKNGIEQVTFADGSTFTEQQLRDRLMSDMKSTGRVVGTENNENYYHTQGDGSYSISDYDYYLGSDQLTLMDSTASSVRFSRVGNDLQITLANGEKITLEHQLDDNKRFGIETLVFSDGSTLNATELRDRMVSDMKHDGLAIGTENSETYHHISGDGSWIIRDYDYDRGTDRLVFDDVTADQITVSRHDNALILTLDNGEVVTVLDQLDDNLRRSIEFFEFSDGNVMTEAQMRNRMVSDMKSTGHVVGTENTESYVHSNGDGSYTISDYDYDKGTDRLTFTNVTANQIVLSRVGNDMIMTLANGEVITLLNHLNSNLRYAIESFQFSDGTILTNLQMQSKLTADMKAAGWLVGSDSSEVFTYQAGEGSYAIFDNNADSDRLDFANVKVSEVSLQRVGNDLAIHVNASGETITLAFYFLAAEFKIPSVSFSDGTVLSSVQLDAVTSARNVFGTAFADTLHGLTGDDSILGQAGADILYGNAGNDTLVGGTGADTMEGGIGDDVYYIDSSSDQVVEAAGEGTDYVESAISWTLAANIENLTLVGTAPIAGVGNSSANVIVGNGSANNLSGLDGNDTISGGADNDTLDGGVGDDVLSGGIGNDVYYVDSASDIVLESASEGTDIVNATSNFVLGSEVENLVLLGALAVEGAGNTLANSLTGNALANLLSGNGGNDTINGNEGNDTIDGGSGVDSLVGGTGDDLYKVDDANDKILELSGAGTDTVEASVSYTLSGNLESLILVGTGSIDGTGNTMSNTLTGNSAANVLTGGIGNDTMIGGAGNDTYVVADIGDQLIEDISGGDDLVQSSISWTLGVDFENLTLVGTGSLAGTGNAVANIVIGNDGTNNLLGLGGDDTIFGGNGSDTLDGGFGSDSLIGGAGNDTFIVDVATDAVLEAADEGTDLVKSSISYTLGLNVENLTLTGAALIDGTGNALANLITGNASANVLLGSAGNDTLSGGDGADTLDGGEGIDSLLGGLGDDVFIIDDAADIISETSSGGIDTVLSSVSFTLATYVEHLTLTGASAINGTGNTLANILTGNAEANLLSGGSGIDTLIGGAGNDTLDGGSGADSMTGGVGDDVFIVDLTTDKLVENGDEGTDLVQSSVAWTLAANFENLTITGASGVAGTGNTVANAIVGNSGNNALSGLAGNDTLVGGGGNDSLNGGIGADQFVFTSTTSGIDIIADFNELDGGSEEGDVLRFDGLKVGTFVYLGTAAFSGGSDNSEARVVGNQVLFDANGDGTADITITLTGLTAASQLAATDFLFV